MKTKRVLVVDDDKIVLASCQRVLEAEGFEVSLMPSAKEAMGFLETHYVDLMIMDVKMPERDGVYLLEAIREKWPLKDWPELPVLVMSGYPTPETIKALLLRGAKEFIVKPFTPDELLAAVHRVFKRSEKNANEKGSGN